MSMKKEIEDKLKLLIGLPLWSIGRAGDLEWFLFGNQRRIVPSRNEEIKIVSDFALHIQCAWRILYRNSIFVASRDRFYPPYGRNISESEEFDWDVPGGNLLDERISRLLVEASNKPLTVISIQADNVGSVNIKFTNDYSLDIFPDDSISSEYWRFFIPYMEEEHFIVTGHGIEK